MGLSSDRRRDRPSADVKGTADDAFVSSLGQGDEWVSLPGVVEGEPAGEGIEATTLSAPLEELASMSVPIGRQAELDEVSVQIAANGAALIAFRGLTYGEYTGPTTATVSFNGTALIEGDDVVVYHRSVDGLETTTKAQISARLF